MISIFEGRGEGGKEKEGGRGKGERKGRGFFFVLCMT